MLQYFPNQSNSYREHVAAKTGIIRKLIGTNFMAIIDINDIELTFGCVDTSLLVAAVPKFIQTDLSISLNSTQSDCGVTLHVGQNNPAVIFKELSPGICGTVYSKVGNSIEIRNSISITSMNSNEIIAEAMVFGCNVEPYIPNQQGNIEPTSKTIILNTCIVV